jgi:hypothetical protein
MHVCQLVDLTLIMKYPATVGATHAMMIPGIRQKENKLPLKKFMFEYNNN